MSNLGTVNTMFAALFRWVFSLSTVDFIFSYLSFVSCLFYESKLGVPIKTTISANVLEEALNGTVTVRPLPIGTAVSGKVLYFLYVERENTNFPVAVFLILMSQFAAGREAMCSFFWCDDK